MTPGRLALQCICIEPPIYQRALGAFGQVVKCLRNDVVDHGADCVVVGKTQRPQVNGT